MNQIIPKTIMCFFIASWVVSDVFAKPFEPFLGEKWVFGSELITKIIQFETELSESEVLYGNSEGDGSRWSLTYTEQSGYDLFYSYIEDDIGKEHHFKFQSIVNNEVSGIYYLFSFESVFDASKSDEIPMTGALLEEDCTVVFNPDDGQLQIPCVTIANSSKTFDVIMEQIKADPMEFKVTTLSKK